MKVAMATGNFSSGYIGCLALLCMLLFLLLPATALAIAEPGAEAKLEQPVDCMGCHAPSADVPVQSILHTVHGRMAAGGNSNCVSCHGASVAHSRAPLEKAPQISFGPHWPSSPRRRDDTCLACHQGGTQMLWAGSVHHDEDIGCSQCHEVHVQRDPLLDDRTQSGVCYQCHPRQRTEANLPSRHPIKEGRTVCSDCHNSHGSAAPYALHQPTLNDNCYSCHAEKRGPYLFEHAPAAEDCSLCHQPHGSINDNLLTARGPFLCQQCHSAAFHPSTLYSGTNLPGGDANQNMLGKNCLNCHSQVHGSNHPSGAVLTR